MNIVIVGAGAIGSLFGGLLAKKNTVVLVGRPPHITTIQRNGLKLTGKTQTKINPTAVESINDVQLTADLIILTVKSYDTAIAVKQTLPLIHDKTIILSLQNGLDNLEKIQKIISKKKIFVGVTTHGAMLTQPGVVNHTGKGKTILGAIDNRQSTRLREIVNLFNEAGIETKMSNNTVQEIWTKAIINSSINPLTAFFRCKNGHLLENPLLEKIVEKICNESTSIAQAEGILLSSTGMIIRTKKVIKDTANNYSSMLQSIQQGKKTEIDSINGKLITIGKKHKIDVSLNKIIVELIKSLNYKEK